MDSSGISLISDRDNCLIDQRRVKRGAGYQTLQYTKVAGHGSTASSQTYSFTFTQIQSFSSSERVNHQAVLILFLPKFMNICALCSIVQARMQVATIETQNELEVSCNYVICEEIIHFVYLDLVVGADKWRRSFKRVWISAELLHLKYTYEFGKYSYSKTFKIHTLKNMISYLHHGNTKRNTLAHTLRSLLYGSRNTPAPTLRLIYRPSPPQPWRQT